MAALFSAGFFNFSPEDSDQVVSKWIWLYFALTAGATLVVFCGWYLFSQRQNRKMMTVMNADARPPLRNDWIDLERGMTASMAPPVTASLWTTRSRSIGDVELFSFGSSADALK
jgi:hypothetical protein